jgi:hypothetical protein
MLKAKGKGQLGLDLEGCSEFSFDSCYLSKMSNVIRHWGVAKSKNFLGWLISFSDGLISQFKCSEMGIIKKMMVGMILESK